MAGPHIARVQLQAFAGCLDRIYGEPAGENPIPVIMDAIEDLMRANSIAVDEMKGDGTVNGNGTKVIRQRLLGSRGYEGHPEVARIGYLTSHDNPVTQHVLRHGVQPAFRFSDFVTQRQLRNLSVFEFNNKVHEWRDQVALVIPTAGGAVSVGINRDRVYTNEEFFVLDLLHQHIRRVIQRCAFFKRLPGNQQLTPREREVLHWVTQGKRDEEIAFLLQSRRGTVSKQVRAILEKLGVENRASAVAMVLAGLEDGHSGTRPAGRPG